ncbi:MAG TPA: hypothetical protein VME24_02075, partial [Alphaproteobacteria bacterium]|nr:hypothetical protein [Alphaproteobacteria bacterium]
MQIEKIQLLLKDITKDPSQKRQTIKEFQDEIWSCPDEESQIIRILRDLAHDLDYFEADPIKRSEDPSFYGEEQLAIEINKALQTIEEIQRKE